MKFQRLMPVEQLADNAAVLFDLLPVKAVDERFIDGGPEGGKQDVQFFRPHVRPADAPPLCLRQKGAGGFCQHLHPVVLEIRIPGSVGTGEQ